MFSTAVTHLQIFGIGFSFGIAGPCFLFCTPILITYILGRRDRLGASLGAVVIFLFGRLAAYTLLGAIVGVSGGALRRVIESGAARYLNITSGIVSILLGVLVLLNREPASCGCNTSGVKAGSNIGSLFVLGFSVGISPCAPLVALLFEIALISKGAFDGAAFAFSFGAGTFLSGIIVIGALAGVLRGIAATVVRSRMGNNIFRIACALLLMAFGAGIIFKTMAFG